MLGPPRPPEPEKSPFNQTLHFLEENLALTVLFQQGWFENGYIMLEKQTVALSATKQGRWA